MEKLFGYGSDKLMIFIINHIVPFHDASFNGPSIEVNVVFGFEEREFFSDGTQKNIVFIIDFKSRKKGQCLFFYGSFDNVFIIKNLQAMSPGQLPFDDIYGISVLIVDIIAIKP